VCVQIPVSMLLVMSSYESVFVRHGIEVVNVFYDAGVVVTLSMLT